MTHCRFYRFVSLFLLLYLFSVYCFAENGKRVVRVGLFERPGIVELGKNDMGRGYGIDYLRLISSYVNWELRSVKLHSRKEVFEALGDGRIDLAIGVVPNETLNKYFSYSKNPVYQFRQELLVNDKERFTRDDYSTWENMRVAMVENRLTNKDFHDYISKNKTKVNPVYFESDVEAEKAFVRGETDALLSIDTNLKHDCYSLQMSDMYNCYFAVNKNNPALLEELNFAISRATAVHPNFQSKLAMRYFPYARRVVLSKSEKKFFESCKQEKRKFRALINCHRYPICFLDENNNFAGGLWEEVKCILDHSGLNYEFIPTKSQDEYRKLVISGDYDILLDSNNNLQRAEELHLNLTKVHSEGPVSAIRLAKRVNEGGKIAVAAASNIYYAIKNAGINEDELMLCVDWNRMKEALISGEARLALLPTRSVNMFINDPTWPPCVAELIPHVSLSYCIGIKQSLPKELMTIINNSISDHMLSHVHFEQKGYEYKGVNAVLLLTYCQNHLSVILSIVTGILLLIFCMLIGYLFHLRKEVMYMDLLKQMPLRYFLLDMKGKVILSDSQPEAFPPDIQRDFASLIENGYNQVLKNGVYDEFVNFSNGTHQHAIFRKFSEKKLSINMIYGLCIDCTRESRLEKKIEENEKFLRLSLQSIKEGIIVADSNGVVTLVNPEAQNLLCKSAKEIIGKQVSTLMTLRKIESDEELNNPDDVTIPLNLKPDSTQIAELVLDKSRQIYVEITTAGILDNRKNQQGTVMAIRDITLEYKSRMYMKESISIIEQIVEVMPFTFYMKRPDESGIFRYVLVNNHASQLFCGIPAKEALGKSNFELPGICQYAEDVQEADIKAYESGETFCRLENLTSFNGDKIALKAYKKKIKVKGKSDILFGFSIDITDLNDALVAARAADKAKSYFLAVMSHEIRTPLNSIIGLSEMLLLGGISKEEQDDFLRSIRTAGDTLLGLINNILDLSKLESGEIKLLTEPGDAHKIAEDLSNVFKIQLRKKGLSFSCVGFERLPILELDFVRLKQVLLNLLGNAVKFTEEGGITMQAEFTPGSNSSGKLRIAVSDTGIGIYEKSFEKIFKLFAQEDDVRGSRKYGGTGLGLCISRKLVEAMGGELTVKSEVGKGSTFTIILPHVKFDTGTLPETRDNMVPATSASGKQTVLLVDDVPLNLKVASAMIKKYGATSVEAGSAADALELFRNQKFNLILTDIWMPEMNGVTLAEKIRELPGGKEIKIIALTADSEANFYFDTSNFNAVISKPITMKKLQGVFS